MPHRVLWFPAVLIVALLAPRAARADTTAEDRAAADALYEAAGKLMKEGRWAEACPKLEASQKLDPGVGTLYRLAYCYAGEGKTASAFSAFNDCEAMARKNGDRRAEDAGKQAKLLEAKLSTLLLDVAPEARAQGVEVKRDGRVVDPLLWGTAVPVDPGAHVVEAAKQGKAPWQTTVTIEAKPGSTTVQIPALADAPAGPADTTSAGPAFWGPQRIAGVAVGGAGIAGLVVGAVFGGITVSKVSASKANGHCAPDLRTCDAIGGQLQHEANTTANVSNVAFALGGTAAVVGVVVFFTAPRAGASAVPAAAWVKLGPVAGTGMTGVLVRGGW